MAKGLKTRMSATAWEYCLLNLDRDVDPAFDGTVTLLNHGNDPVGGIVPLEKDPSGPLSDDIYTLTTMVASLGSEGWEAFSVSPDGAHWYFKRPIQD